MRRLRTACVIGAITLVTMAAGPASAPAAPPTFGSVCERQGGSISTIEGDAHIDVVCFRSEPFSEAEVRRGRRACERQGGSFLGAPGNKLHLQIQRLLALGRLGRGQLRLPLVAPHELTRSGTLARRLRREDR